MVCPFIELKRFWQDVRVVQCVNGFAGACQNCSFMLKPTRLSQGQISTGMQTIIDMSPLSKEVLYLLFSLMIMSLPICNGSRFN